MLTALTEDDVLNTAQLIRGYAEELGFSNEFSIKHTCQKLSDMDLCFIWKENGDVLGVIGGSVGSSPWTPDVSIMHEEIYYIHPVKRKGRIGYVLLDTFVHAVEHMKVDMMTMKTMVSSPALERGYNRYGLTKLETTYIRRF